VIHGNRPLPGDLRPADARVTRTWCAGPAGCSTRLILAVAASDAAKKPLFSSLDERHGTWRKRSAGALIPSWKSRWSAFPTPCWCDFVRAEEQPAVVLRGLRAVSDFRVRVSAGRHEPPRRVRTIETVFLTPARTAIHLSSRPAWCARSPASAAMSRKFVSAFGGRPICPPQEGNTVGFSGSVMNTNKGIKDGSDDHRRMHQLRCVRAGVPEQRHLPG
jgi:phosphopantetheine adenylyltransferase